MIATRLQILLREVGTAYKAERDVRAWAVHGGHNFLEGNEGNQLQI